MLHRFSMKGIKTPVYRAFSSSSIQASFRQEQRQRSSQFTLKTGPLALGFAGIATSLYYETKQNAALNEGSSRNNGDNDDYFKLIKEYYDKNVPKTEKEFHELLEKVKKDLNQIPTDSEGLKAQLNDFIDSGKATQVSFGFAMGYCSGMVLRRISRASALIVGSLFIGMQYASYYGYLDVNYRKIERSFRQYFDINQDGNVDQKDFDLLKDDITKVLEFNIPAGSGFGAGLLLGLRHR